MLARLQLPQRIRRGDVVEVRLNIQHPMEIGTRRDKQGVVVTRNVMPYLKVQYNGQLVFKADLGSGIAANPYLQFWIVAGDSGEITAEWRDESGATGSVRGVFSVEA